LDAEWTQEWTQDFSGEQDYAGQHGEMIANIMLAYRHLEDARMRLGKVLQAQDGGTSIYDKEKSNPKG